MLKIQPDLKALNNGRFETLQLICKINDVIKGYLVSMSLRGPPKGKKDENIVNTVDSGFPQERILKVFVRH